MHFEILVEDRSGKIALKAIVDGILESVGAGHTCKIISFQGLGRIPPDLKSIANPRKRLLLDRLPKLLRGYGRSYRNYSATVVVLVDLDDKDCLEFKQEMLEVLDDCEPKPATLVRIAIEEIEAWLLGDRDAVKTAYPRAKEAVLNDYVQDSICGTWEKLADAIYPGGSQKLKRTGYPEAGRIKCEWAERISLHLDPERNRSTSFRVFCSGIRNLAQRET